MTCMTSLLLWQASIHSIILALIAILGWYASLVDVNGAFLLGHWESNREIYMEVPEGWEHHYPEGSVLKLLKTIYGRKQCAKQFWIKALAVLDEMGFSRSKANPCLYSKWHLVYCLVLIVSWVDDFRLCGCKAGVEEAKKEFFTHFECDDTGTMNKYIGNIIDHSKSEIKMTQPVLLQSFMDEFDLVQDHKITVP
jgi:Reverse transcriptase (RNA-dependent DNA polymerase)